MKFGGENHEARHTAHASFRAALIAFFLFASAAATTTGTKYKSAGGPLNAVAMDGSLVAYDVGERRLAERTRRQGSRLERALRQDHEDKRQDHRPGGHHEHRPRRRGAAVAGQRVAWIINQGGDIQSDDYLYASLLPKPTEKKLATARRTGDVMGVVTGNWIGGLVGYDELLAVNRWATDATGTVTTAGLSVIGANNLEPIASGFSTMLAQAADAGRVAVLRSDGSVVCTPRPEERCGR